MSAMPARATASPRRSATTRAAPTTRIARSLSDSFTIVYYSPKLTTLEGSAVTVITAREAPTFDAGGATITGLASPSRGSADTAVWRVRFHPDRPSPRHAVSREEIFIVLEGAITARFGDHEETATAGGALIVPANEEFTLTALGAPAEAVCTMPIGGQAISDGTSFT